MNALLFFTMVLLNTTAFAQSNGDAELVQSKYSGIAKEEGLF